MTTTTVPAVITVEWLRERDACLIQVAMFVAAFGTRAELTRQNLVLAVLAGLDLSWLAPQLLEGPTWKAYEGAMAVARRACELAMDAGLDLFAARMAYRGARAKALADALGLE